MVSPPAVIPAQAGICPLRRDNCTGQPHRRHPGASRNLSFTERRLRQPNPRRHSGASRYLSFTERRLRRPNHLERVVKSSVIPAQAGICPLWRDGCTSQTTRRHPGASRNLPFAARRLHQPNHPSSSRRKPEPILYRETIAPAKPPVVIPAQAGTCPLPGETIAPAKPPAVIPAQAGIHPLPGETIAPAKPPVVIPACAGIQCFCCGFRPYVAGLPLPIAVAMAPSSCGIAPARIWQHALAPAIR